MDMEHIKCSFIVLARRTVVGWHRRFEGTYCCPLYVWRNLFQAAAGAMTVKKPFYNTPVFHGMWSIKTEGVVGCKSRSYQWELWKRKCEDRLCALISSRSNWALLFQPWRCRHHVNIQPYTMSRPEDDNQNVVHCGLPGIRSHSHVMQLIHWNVGAEPSCTKCLQSFRCVRLYIAFISRRGYKTWASHPPLK
jgi:hypothetical protein